MNGVPDYYGQTYAPVDPSGSIDQYAADRSLSDPGDGTMDSNILEGAQTLDQIINHNQEMMRRRSTFHPQYRHNAYTDSHQRRASMMEFGSSMGNDLAEFQFDPNPTAPNMPDPMAAALPAPKSLDPRKVRSREELSLDTRFSQMNTGFEPNPSVTTYSPALVAGVSMPMDPSSAYLTQAMDMPMEFENLSGDTTPVNMPGTSLTQPVFTDSPLTQNFSLTYRSPNQDPDGASSIPHTPVNATTPSQSGLANSQKAPLAQRAQFSRHQGIQTPLSASQVQEAGTMPTPAHVQQIKQRRMSTSDIASQFANPGKHERAGQAMCGD